MPDTNVYFQAKPGYTEVEIAPGKSVWVDSTWTPEDMTQVITNYVRKANLQATPATPSGGFLSGIGGTVANTGKYTWGRTKEAAHGIFDPPSQLERSVPELALINRGIQGLDILTKLTTGPLSYGLKNLGGWLGTKLPLPNLEGMSGYEGEPLKVTREDVSQRLGEAGEHLGEFLDPTTLYPLLKYGPKLLNKARRLPLKVADKAAVPLIPKEAEIVGRELPGRVGPQLALPPAGGSSLTGSRVFEAGPNRVVMDYPQSKLPRALPPAPENTMYRGRHNAPGESGPVVGEQGKRVFVAGEQPIGAYDDWTYGFEPEQIQIIRNVAREQNILPEELIARELGPEYFKRDYTGSPAKEGPWTPQYRAAPRDASPGNPFGADPVNIEARYEPQTWVGAGPVDPIEPRVRGEAVLPDATLQISGPEIPRLPLLDELPEAERLAAIHSPALDPPIELPLAKPKRPPRVPKAYRTENVGSGRNLPLDVEEPAQTVTDAATSKPLPKPKGMLRTTSEQMWIDPLRVAKNSKDASLETIITDAFARRSNQKRISDALNIRTQGLIKDVGDDELKLVLQYLDTPDGAALARNLSPQASNAYTGLREVLDEIADATGLERNRRLVDYFPRQRIATGIKSRQIVDLPGEEYLPRVAMENMPEKWKPFFLKERSLTDTQLPDYDINMLENYYRAVADRIATAGGRMPFADEAIEGYIPGLKRQKAMEGVLDTNLEYATEYMNNILGVNKSTKSKLGLSPETASNVNRAMYWSKLGPNIGGAMGNLTQLALTASKVAPTDFIGGLYDLGKFKLGLGGDELRQLTEKFAPMQSLAADIGLERQLRPNLLKKIGHGMSTPFRASQEATEQGTIFAANRRANRLGLVGKEGDDSIRNILAETQQWGIPENMPLAWQTMSPEFRVAAQFKNFPRQYANFMIQQGREDIADIISGNWKQKLRSVGSDLTAAAQQGPGEFGKALINSIDKMPMSKLGRQIAIIGMLGGTDALTAGMDKHIAGYFTGDRQAIPNAVGGADTNMGKFVSGGLAKMVGVHVGRMLGLGALPVEDLSNLAFFLPGPALSTVMDVAGATASALSGNNIEISVERGIVNHGVATPADYLKHTEKIIRDIPIAGIPVTGAMRAIRNARAEDQEFVRAPQNISQMIGLEPIPALAREVKPMEQEGLTKQGILDATGLISTKQEAYRDRLKEAQNMIGQRQINAGNLADWAARTGEVDWALKTAQALGIDLTAESIREAMERAVMGREQTIIRRAPKSMRPDIMNLFSEPD